MNLSLSEKHQKPDFINVDLNIKEDILEKYSIDLMQVSVNSSLDITLTKAEKKLLVIKALEAYELAQKNYNYGNITKLGYATNIGLENGLWYCGTNFNNTRNQISAICGERSAIIGAYNELLKSKKLNNSKDEVLDFRVKYIVMAGFKPHKAEKTSANPCAECLSWFNTSRYFSDDTIIVSLQRNKNENPYLCISKIIEYLPLRNEIVEYPIKDIDTMPVKVSDNAVSSIREYDIDLNLIRQQVKITKEKYDNNI